MIYSLDDINLILARCGPMPDELRDAMRGAAPEPGDQGCDPWYASTTNATPVLPRPRSR